MLDQTNDFKWKIFKNGIRCFAIVNIDVLPNLSGQNEIKEYYSGKGFFSQGYIEEVPEVGYQSWKLAAIKGLEFAFSLVETNWTVQINKIGGRALIDTNPTVAGYTIMMAFLDKIGFHLDIKQIDIFEDFVLKSWSKPYKELIPDFLNLTYAEYK
ncbi:hypothetical protein SAMN05428988_1596 [Chitinophaga sp. YR573]|uniref:hypothetical protein n=1 Tax=Chitinophaga sp. YR573 TaxID=1881040 RepID=UPI0008AAD47F|nr:hypothetical protein [Chitinophaga sp. YR573]SEW05142.1 hypothetical protein SAMN05428988_1596 [Chitinophaga sp. YR573]